MLNSAFVDILYLVQEEGTEGEIGVMSRDKSATEEHSHKEIGYHLRRIFRTHVTFNFESES